ncbi:unnamed protein product [Lupinus luteus]|uniref:Uncharacterized protein n=1 Tax=Lupinus luteus TaxID=3873 RepID=A0AAV1W354_LUPLU
MDYNNVKLYSTIARNKRKCVLRDKGINYARARIQHASIDSQKQNSTPMQMSRTPLSQISLNCDKETNQSCCFLNSHSSSSSTTHTQPSTIHENTRKRSFVNKQSLGINLMDRYGIMHE